MYRPLPPPEAERHVCSREAGVQQPEPEGKGAISAPETGKLHQTTSMLPLANHIFLGSWMVDICQEGHSLRSAPQRRHKAYLS